MNVSRAAGIVWRDFTLLLVLGFVAMVVILLPFVNPPETDDAAEPPGNLIVAMHWPEGDIDIDMWLMGPGEGKPVGYSNKAGQLFNLLRDDLGNPDPARNYENSYTRGIVPGEYVVNVHLYRGPFPITVEVEVSINDGKPGKASIRKLVSTNIELTRKGEERTALRFRLDGDGNLEPNSVNSVFRPLRAASGYQASGSNPDYGD